MLNHNALMTFAGISGDREPQKFRLYFDEAMHRMPAAFPWLEQPFLQEAAEFYGLSEEKRKLYLEAAGRILASARLRQLFWLYYYVTYEGSQPLFHTWTWPFPEGTVAPVGSRAFPNVVLLAGYAVHKRTLATSGLPSKILKRQQASIAHEICSEFGKYTGGYGPVALWQKGSQYILGRLNYEMGETEIEQFKILRSVKTGETVLIATQGRFTPDGFFHAEDGEDGFDASYVVGTDSYIAHPVHPDGYVMQQTFRFAYEEWVSPFLFPCETVHIHIPPAQPFNPEPITASFKRLRRFVKRFFPNFHPKLLFCETWMISPQVTACLDESKNISRFARRYYRFPNSHNLGDVLYFLFDASTDVPFAQLKEDTSLQRKVKAKLLAGERVETSCGFILWDDWDKPDGYYHGQSFFSK